MLDADIGQKSLMTWSSLTPDDYPTVSQPVLSQLKRDIARSDADLILVDGPPRADADVRRILRAAELVLMPVVPGLFDLGALTQSLEVIQEVQDDRAEHDQAPLIVRSFINRGKLRHRGTQDAKEALIEAGIDLIPGMLGDRAAIGRATDEGSAAVDLEPSSVAAKEVRQLAEHVLELLEVAPAEAEAAI